MLLAPGLPRALFFKHQKNSNFKVSKKIKNATKGISGKSK
jgi:hypothetical protein